MSATEDAAVAELAGEAHAFARDWVAEHGGYDDCWMTGHSRDAALAVGRRGWIGMTWPRAVGGGWRAPIERLVVLEALIEHGVPIADWWFADQTIGSVLVEYGTRSQQQRWLPDLIAGRARWTLASTEPQAGSDPMSMTTTATVEGESVRVNGTKMWVLGPADWCYLICRTEAPDDGGGRGLSEFVVDMNTVGLSFEPIKDSSGRTDFGYLRFNDVRIPLANRIGRGNTKIRLLEKLDAERGGIDRLVSNRAVYLDARRRVDRRDPDLRREVMQLEQDYRVGRLLVLKSSLEPPYPGFGAVVKLFCSEFSQRVAEFAVHASGPEGLLDTRATRAFIYSTAYTIMGGASEILRTVVADRILGLSTPK